MREVWQIRMVSLMKETEQQNSQIIYLTINCKCRYLIYQLLYCDNRHGRTHKITINMLQVHSSVRGYVWRGKFYGTVITR